MRQQQQCHVFMRKVEKQTEDEEIISIDSEFIRFDKSKNTNDYVFSESHRRLAAAEFSAGNPQHIAQLAHMGIQLQTMADGRKYIVCIFSIDTIKNNSRYTINT
jgi:hypothetical protein